MNVCPYSGKGEFSNEDPQESSGPVFRVPEDLRHLDSMKRGQPVRFTERSLLRRDLGDLRSVFTVFSAGTLQLAHPVIGSAVGSEQSRFFEDPWERLYSSASHIGKIVLAEDATTIGHQIRDFHKGIFGEDANGKRVSALHPEPYAWGWLTILRMAEQKKLRFEPPRSQAHWQQWYKEGLAAYKCQGVSDHHMPADYNEYKEHMQDMFTNGRLQRTPTAARFLDRLENCDPPRPKQFPELAWNRLSRASFGHYVRILTVGGLPQPVRETLGAKWSRLDQFALDSLDLAVRNLWDEVIPPRLAYHPDTARALFPTRNLSHRVQLKLNDVLARTMS